MRSTQSSAFVLVVSSENAVWTAHRPLHSCSKSSEHGRLQHGQPKAQQSRNSDPRLHPYYPKSLPSFCRMPASQPTLSVWQRPSLSLLAAGTKVSGAGCPAADSCVLHGHLRSTRYSRRLRCTQQSSSHLQKLGPAGLEGPAALLKSASPRKLPLGSEASPATGAAELLPGG